MLCLRLQASPIVPFIGRGSDGLAGTASDDLAPGHRLEMLDHMPKPPPMTSPSNAGFLAPPLGGRVRGVYLQLMLERVDELPHADTCAILGAIADHAVAEIRGAGRTAWLPIEHDLECRRAIARRLGPRRSHQFFIDLGVDACACTPMRGLVQSVVHNFCSDIARAVRWIPRAFTLLARDAGTWTVTEQAEGVATLQVTGLPDGVARDIFWTQTVASELHAWFRITDTRGAVTVQDASALERRVSFRLRWM